jgi:hypothetical protein
MKISVVDSIKKRRLETENEECVGKTHELSQ